MLIFLHFLLILSLSLSNTFSSHALPLSLLCSSCLSLHLSSHHTSPHVHLLSSRSSFSFHISYLHLPRMFLLHTSFSLTFPFHFHLPSTYSLTLLHTSLFFPPSVFTSTYPVLISYPPFSSCSSLLNSPPTIFSPPFSITVLGSLSLADLIKSEGNIEFRHEPCCMSWRTTNGGVNI